MPTKDKKKGEWAAQATSNPTDKRIRKVIKIADPDLDDGDNEYKQEKFRSVASQGRVPCCTMSCAVVMFQVISVPALRTTTNLNGFEVVTMVRRPGPNNST